VNETLSGYQVTPKEADAPLSAGAFSADVGDIIVPIFLDAAASTHVLLPLKATKLLGTLSEDRNCIGKYNADKLDPANSCLAEPPDTLPFENAGALEGFITLEHADGVIIEDLKQSLCVLLSGNAQMYGDAGTPNKCKRDMAGKIVYQGDWCAATNASADASCADAMKLSANFAASAVSITGMCEAVVEPACYDKNPGCAEYITDAPTKPWCDEVVPDPTPGVTNPSYELYQKLSLCTCGDPFNPALVGKCEDQCKDEACAGNANMAGGACVMCIQDTMAGCGNEFNACANDL
jgi:hypothetical protein